MSIFNFIFKTGNGNAGKQLKSCANGEVFFTAADGKYYLYKLLVADPGNDCYHLLMYEPLVTKPVPSDLGRLTVLVYHSPFAGRAFEEITLLGNAPVTSGDLIGYHEYLRQTSGPEYYFPVAEAYYLTALQLTDGQKHEEAIDAYSKAIDLLPHFFEAIDNRAFCKMDLGRWDDAISDFRLSLQVNPNTVLAEFSIGECYLKMGDLQNAKSQFEIAHKIDPAAPAPKQFLDMIKSKLNG